MPSEYQSDRDIADLYIDQVRRILGPFIIDIASFDRDTKQATDLIVLAKNDLTIACRIRRPGYAALYPDDFTIRYARDNGAETELSKIRKGWARWFFYGHLAGEVIAAWMLLDLDVFRKTETTIPPVVIPNTDGTWLAAYQTVWFPCSLVIAKYRDEAAVAHLQPPSRRRRMTREELLELARQAALKMRNPKSAETAIDAPPGPG